MEGESGTWLAQCLGRVDVYNQASKSRRVQLVSARRAYCRETVPMSEDRWHELADLKRQAQELRVSARSSERSRPRRRKRGRSRGALARGAAHAAAKQLGEGAAPGREPPQRCVGRDERVARRAAEVRKRHDRRELGGGGERGGGSAGGKSQSKRLPVSHHLHLSCVASERKLGVWGPRGAPQTTKTHKPTTKPPKTPIPKKPPPPPPQQKKKKTKAGCGGSRL